MKRRFEISNCFYLHWEWKLPTTKSYQDSKVQLPTAITEKSILINCKEDTLQS
jgi:hypothetical protein